MLLDITFFASEQLPSTLDTFATSSQYPVSPQRVLPGYPQERQVDKLKKTLRSLVRFTTHLQLLGEAPFPKRPFHGGCVAHLANWHQNPMRQPKPTWRLPASGQALSPTESV